MNTVKRDMQSVLKGLNLLTQRTAKLAKKMERLEKRAVAKSTKMKRTPKRAKGGVTKKMKRGDATNMVLAIINRRRKGVDTATLKMKTNFDEIKLRNIIHRLKKQGKIKAERRGVYVKA